MADLIAQGCRGEFRWRRKLQLGETWSIGRAVGVWSVPWDECISRRHAELSWDGDSLRVRQVAGTQNPIFYQGQGTAEFALKAGGHFVIGHTTFSLVDESVRVLPDDQRPTAERAFDQRDLQRLRFQNAEERIEMLNRLPEIIRGALNERELHLHFVNVLLAGLPRASYAAVVVARNQPGNSGPIDVLYWDGRPGSGPFAPSEALIRKAVSLRESVVHEWSGTTRNTATFTQSAGVDWAFCSPVQGDSCRGWAVYVSGRHASDESHGPPQVTIEDLREDVKFTEIAASILGSLKDLRWLEHRQSFLRQFLSPVVIEALADADPDTVLTPKETDVAVLFCDLRGFSRTSEQYAQDLMGLLRRVSEALRVMTRHIFEQGGVVGDFHGDCAMGFWGWPLPQSDSVERACRAALAIRQTFEEAAAQNDHSLADFRLGIGIASGRAVAGKIGAVEQVKVTVFGPVVNLAARLQELTKPLRAPILLDESTSRRVRAVMPRDQMRVRRVARVQPYGLQNALEVSELLPPTTRDPVLSDLHLQAYEAALDAVLQRRWADAFRLLHQVPAEDRVKDFLTVFIAQHNRTPPEGWDGIIPLPFKG